MPCKIQELCARVCPGLHDLRRTDPGMSEYTSKLLTPGFDARR